MKAISKRHESDTKSIQNDIEATPPTDKAISKKHQIDITSNIAGQASREDDREAQTHIGRVRSWPIGMC